ncbi:Alpha/beta hydrolase fold-1 [Infundibulicybe gibba]|nr:Alpha/beta hydrolase fold-1 [Infundibulicybe gibba]
MLLEIEPFIFGSPSDDGQQSLQITAKRYTLGTSADNCHGLTLLFAHCIGAHKEQWEPTIQEIFRLQGTKGGVHRIREAWSFDWQSHGDAAILNRVRLNKRSSAVSTYEWSSAITSFVRSERMSGHRIVLLGHSAGAATMVMMTKNFSASEMPFVSLVLVEPTIITRELFNQHLEDRQASMDFAISATSVRRDSWPSREEAFTYFSKRFPWSLWDPRVIRIMTDYGLRETPTGVVLKCDRKQEAASYPDVAPHFESAIQLARICHVIPTHIIWGTRNDFVPEFIQESLNSAPDGRIPASVTKVKGTGHMVRNHLPNSILLRAYLFKPS